MKKFKDCTLQEYLDCLSKKEPVPGGGSVAALTAALAAGLISMVANYSIGKNTESVERKIKTILEGSEKIRKRLLELVDLDAQAYLNVVKTRKAAPEIKKKALAQARQVPFEVGQLCYNAVQLTPYLVQKGNFYLMSDIQVANELLLAAFNSAMVNVRCNQ